MTRKLAGESAAFQVFKVTRGQSGLVAFAQTIPGEIMALNIEEYGEFYVQKDGFIAAENTVDFDIALTKKVGAGMFGGEGLFLATLSGNGKVILQSMNITSLARTLFKNSVKSSPRG